MSTVVMTIRVILAGEGTRSQEYLGDIVFRPATKGLIVKPEAKISCKSDTTED